MSEVSLNYKVTQFYEVLLRLELTKLTKLFRMLTILLYGLHVQANRMRAFVKSASIDMIVCKLGTTLEISLW